MKQKESVIYLSWECCCPHLPSNTTKPDQRTTSYLRNMRFWDPKKNTTYYVRVCAIGDCNGRDRNGKWSAVKK